MKYFLLKYHPINIPKIYASEYHLISKEKTENATGSKLLMNICLNGYKPVILNKTMKNSKFVFDKLSQLFEQGLVSSKDLGNEIVNILRSKRDEIVFRMKLTSKDEFDVLSKRVENLENKLAKLRNSSQKKTKVKAKKVKQAKRS